ncbi:hypothetical protein B1748_05220 [Paenibacillus sp. MY03]|jgi:hypothetical protein|nr:hypothetical protein B1748_05220 [Paenibacillus sp. MY03]
MVDAGIGGDSASGGLKRVERDVLRFVPDLVIVAPKLLAENHDMPDRRVVDQICSAAAAPTHS